MSLPRLEYATRIADHHNELATIVKTRSRASLTDANQILETVAKRFFNALKGWNLVNLNALRANYPAADLGDAKRRLPFRSRTKTAPTRSSTLRTRLPSTGLVMTSIA